MTYMKKIIRRFKYSLNTFLYRFRSKESNHFIYEQDDEDPDDEIKPLVATEEDCKVEKFIPYYQQPENQ